MVSRYGNIIPYAATHYLVYKHNIMCTIIMYIYRCIYTHHSISIGVAYQTRGCFTTFSWDNKLLANLLLHSYTLCYQWYHLYNHSNHSNHSNIHTLKIHLQICSTITFNLLVQIEWNFINVIYRVFWSLQKVNTLFKNNTWCTHRNGFHMLSYICVPQAPGS